jgi:hypothetical protein
MMERSQALSIVMLVMFTLPMIAYLPIDTDILMGFVIATATLFVVAFRFGLLTPHSVASLVPTAIFLAILAPAIAYRLALPLSVPHAKLSSFKLATTVDELRASVSAFGAMESVIRMASFAGSAAPPFVLTDVEASDDVIEPVAELPVSMLAEMSGYASSSLGATGGTLQLLYVRTTRRVKGEDVTIVLPVLAPPVSAEDAENDKVVKPAWHADHDFTEAELAAVVQHRQAAAASRQQRSGALKQPEIFLSGELIPFDVTASEDAAQFRLKKKYKNVRPFALLLNVGSGVGAPSVGYPVLSFALLFAPLALFAAYYFDGFYTALGDKPRNVTARRAVMKK